MSFGVAVIGYGLAGRALHAPLIPLVEGLRLAAVVSRQADAVKAAYPDTAVYATPDAAFADPAVDLVVVATPNTTHFDLAARALAAGKHVVVDKPFAATSQEARELIRRAAQANRLLAVYHSRRWDSDFRTLQRLIGEGALGDVTYFESRYDRFRPVVQDRWRERAGPATGTWYDLGSHLVDQALQLFGRPQSVFADLAAQRSGAQTTDYFHVLFRYERRRVVLTGSSLAAANVRRFVVHGTRASFVKDGFDPQEPHLRAGGEPTALVDPSPACLVLPDGQVRTPEAEPGDYRDFYAGMRDAMAGQGLVPVPAADGLAVMELLEAAEASAEGHLEMPLV